MHALDDLIFAAENELAGRSKELTLLAAHEKARNQVRFTEHKTADEVARTIFELTDAADGSIERVQSAVNCVNSAFGREAGRRVAKEVERDISRFLETDREYDDHDPTESGPCGPLWSNNQPPEWFVDAYKDSRRRFHAPKDRELLTHSVAMPLSDHDDQLSRKLERANTERERAWAEFSKLEVEHTLTRSELRSVGRELSKVTRERDDLKAQLSERQIELEHFEQQPPSWYIKQFSTPATIFQFGAILLLVSMILVTLLGISEVHRRQALGRWLGAEIDALRDREINGMPNVDATAILRARHQLETLHFQLQVLSLAGSDEESETIDGLSKQLHQVQTSPINTSRTFSLSAPRKGLLSFLASFVPVAFQASDFLLSLVVLLSGTVGAVIARLRIQEQDAGLFRMISLRDLGIGFAAGFITFLCIRGGKSVFLIDADPLLLINPYNSAFFGLLAGLFTDMAFGLLRGLAQQIVCKLESAFLPANGNARDDDGKSSTANGKSQSSSTNSDLAPESLHGIEQTGSSRELEGTP